ncbi:MAG: hypothetical protein IJS15_04045 [Victivallales bacterium]|nr:hypothetical protein [Victivallales bacterium]
MNEKELDALLEQMKNRPLTEQDGMSDEELLNSFRRRRKSHDGGGARKAAALVLLLASLGFCFYAIYGRCFRDGAIEQCNPPLAWYFLPCFDKDVRGVEIPPNGDEHFYDSVPEPIQRLLSPDSGLTEAQRSELHWREASFPHCDFAKLMPQRNVFGWYGCEFDVPNSLAGMDVLVDLGIIDDADETFVNGTIVGAMGKVTGGSAWQADRQYRIPDNILSSSRNYLAVHVWSLWGFGGIAGAPVIKAALCPSDAHWESSFYDAKSVPADGLNSAESLEAALSLFSPTENKTTIPIGAITEWEGDSHYAVFRTSFSLMADDKPRRFSSSVILDMGAVFDVTAVFLNGRRIGLVGRFPEGDFPAFTEAAQRVRLAVPPNAWSKDGHNELAAVIYRERGRGGLAGQPGILLDNPLAMEEQSFAQLSDYYYILLQSGDRKAVEKLLGKMRPENDNEKAWLLSHNAHVSFLKWLDGGMKDDMLLENILSPIAEIIDNLPDESPKQSAMQAFCHVLRLAERVETLLAKVRRYFPSFREHVTYVGEDNVTRGDWPLQYGTDGYVLSAMGQLMDIHSPFAKYGIRLPVEHGRPGLYLNLNLRDIAAPEALIVPKGAYDAFAGMMRVDFMSSGQHLAPGRKLRRASWWDDKGEMHPFDDNGPDLLIDWSVKTSMQRIALYFLDFDWRNTLHPRQQSVIVYDSDGKFQDAVWLGKICHGNYSLFETTSEKTTFRVNKHRSASSCISGVFSDNSKFTPTSGGLPPHVAMLIARILEIEKRHVSHMEFDTLRGDFRSISSIDDAKAFVTALDSIGVRTPRWRMMLLARIFELLDGMEGEELLKAAQTIKSSLNLRLVVHDASDVVLLNYLLKRGVPSDAPLCAEIRKNLPKWQKRTIIIP